MRPSQFPSEDRRDARSLDKDARTTLAKELMAHFADRTGLVSGREPRRYLWTDAFAVCNFLMLDRITGETQYLELALRLVEQVHATLGRHRSDDPRRGWISGLPDTVAEAHPTRGGLRIGKPLPERGPREPFDDRLEWERDGQYFHYLTKWMHALDRVALATKQPQFASWARELAIAAHHGFTYEPPTGGAKRMIWKASIDLSRPLVPSMGHHDPLDGFVTCVDVEATGRVLGLPADAALANVRSELAAMIEPDQLATADPLGLGGLLVDADRLDRLEPSNELVDAILAAAHAGLQHYVRQPDLRSPASRRLAFRELGLAIGLGAVESMQQRAILDQLARFFPVRAEIETFWQAPANRTVESWREHEDINAVMLATSLLPAR